ncbi:putative ribonuclease P subunit 3 [Hyphodiscus hymeniophilus]|uniref:Ribonuclease P subunit 3 n=1 Tax=Hyphodiscus hymeniophilus TaxID=353542 RepID=A0A9P6VN59_9HELO|nr:putative ribonuclease P subunit 3 [Hyphodiscus hymeniophilus]
MLYDLNVPWSPTTPSTDLQRTVSFLSSLGYQTLALNHLITGHLPPQITNPIPSEPPFSVSSTTTLLRRCTLKLADPTQNHRLPALSSVYDILALRPTTEKAYLAACQTLTEHSIISLDLTVRYPFHFKPKPLMTAVNAGIRIEICYTQGVLGDGNARRNFISNCMAIFRATKGRGLILSSEAKNVLGVRAPADVVNLMAVWGLGRERGEEGLGVNPRGVVVNEGIKRSSFRGVVDVVYGGERAVEVPKAKAKTVQSGIGKKGKRERDDKDIADGTPTVSKRQQKKMRLEALKAGKESSSPSKESTPMGDSTELSEGASTMIPEANAPSTIKAQANG